MRMNLNAVRKRIEALEAVMAKRCNAMDLVLSDEEYAAFGLASSSLLATYDPEYAVLAASFRRMYDKTRTSRPVDPAEVEAAMRLTVRGDDEAKAAARRRQRSLMNAVFERCGFDYAADEATPGTGETSCLVQ